MENTERSEALNAIDVIAAEIHAEYMKVAESQGHKLKPWSEVPDSAKTMCRTLARLTLSKMEKVYLEAREKIQKEVEAEFKKATVSQGLPKTDAPAPPAPPKRTVEDVNAILDGITKKVKECLETYEQVKTGNPLEQGIDNAIRKFSEMMAIDVLKENPELQGKLKENVAEALTSGLLGDEKEE